MISIPRLLDLYIRAFVLVLAVTFGIVFLFAGARAALAASLKTVSVINSDTLRLGDVFDGLSEERANYVLGPAPQPGQDMVLNANTLMRVALSLDLPWRPSTSADQIVIRRNATTISEDDIRGAINNALREKGVDGKFNLILAGSVPQMILPSELPATVEIASMKFDPAKDWFEVSLAAPSAATMITRASLTGRIQRLVSVPTLQKTLRNGDIISAADINWIEVDTKDLQNDQLLKEEDFIGKTPRRMVNAGKPVRDNELEKPSLIERGDMVTLVYRTGPITLTAKGKALQGGAAGDLVKFVNIASNRTLDGIVSADHEITVMD
ncbi:MAG TPA: flagellar basal body P-ring formation chaperone FlgA [Alphaproteobacteria bacterium]|jgi:flagella basal body P-ring formation protein FlgA